MKTQFNLTTSECDLERFENRDALLELLEGFDGVELLYAGEDTRGIVSKDDVVGLHMSCFPYWLDLWNGDMDACVEEFGSYENVVEHFGGDDRTALVDHYRRELGHARDYGAEYVVFHVSDCNLEEAMTGRYRHSDEEVIDAVCELIGEVFPPGVQGPTLLLENLWEAGMTFTDPVKTRRLLDGIAYPDAGIMLDTGHLMHTNLSLRTQKEAAAYVERMLDLHGDLCERVRGIHLNQSLTGPFIRKVMKNPPEILHTPEERFWQMFDYIFKVDLHRPFVCPQVRDVIERVAPEYLTFEFISNDLEEHRRMLRRQQRALRA